MAGKHSLSNGFFRLYLCNYCGDVPDISEFDDWDSAYSCFRSFTHYLGWHFGRIIYVSYSGEYREIVRAQHINGHFHCEFCNVFPDFFDVTVESLEEQDVEWHQFLQYEAECAKADWEAQLREDNGWGCDYVF